MIYVFRPSNPPLALKPAIIVNGVKMADSTNKGSIDLELNPGTYTIKADWSRNSRVPDSEMVLHVEMGQTYYVMVDSSMHATGDYMTTGTGVAPVMAFEGGLALVDSTEATGMMALCGTVKTIPGALELIRPCEE
jgi:hypothetical protein